MPNSLNIDPTVVDIKFPGERIEKTPTKRRMRKTELGDLLDFGINYP